MVDRYGTTRDRRVGPRAAPGRWHRHCPAATGGATGAAGQAHVVSGRDARSPGDPFDPRFPPDAQSQLPVRDARGRHHGRNRGTGAAQPGAIIAGRRQPVFAAPPCRDAPAVGSHAAAAAGRGRNVVPRLARKRAAAACARTAANHGTAGGSDLRPPGLLRFRCLPPRDARMDRPVPARIPPPVRRGAAPARVS